MVKRILMLYVPLVGVAVATTVIMFANGSAVWWAFGALCTAVVLMLAYGATEKN